LVCFLLGVGRGRVGISGRAFHSRWNQWVDNHLMLLGHWTHDNSLNQKVGETILISFLVLFVDLTCTQYHTTIISIRFAQSSNVTTNKGRQKRSSTPPWFYFEPSCLVFPILFLLMGQSKWILVTTTTQFYYYFMGEHCTPHLTPTPSQHINQTNNS
jgi:hypothetical protein